METHPKESGQIIDKKQRRKHWTKKAIKDHWWEYLVKVGKFDSYYEVVADDCCFACGWQSRTHKAHIHSLGTGGADDPSNIHLLCPQCHSDSEGLVEAVDDDLYWQWFIEMNQINRAMKSYKGTLEGLLSNDKNDILKKPEIIKPTQRKYIAKSKTPNSGLIVQKLLWGVLLNHHFTEPPKPSKKEKSKCSNTENSSNYQLSLFD